MLFYLNFITPEWHIDGGMCWQIVWLQRLLWRRWWKKNTRKNDTFARTSWKNGTKLHYETWKIVQFVTLTFTVGRHVIQRQYLLFKTPLNEIEVAILWLNASVYLSIQFSFWQSVATESCSLSFHFIEKRAVCLAKS